MPPTAPYPPWLLPYEPQVPLPELIVRANELFHDFEARHYDRVRPEAKVYWANLWREMIGAALRESRDRSWHILDFGCGTGFATLQLLKYLPPASVASLTCYDLSPRMLERCRDKVRPVFPAARFCNQPEELACGPFNLLATNALLHHLPSPAQTLGELLPHLEHDAIWLAGIEPSVRFYKNAECVRHHDHYQRQRRRNWLRYVTPGYWRTKIARLLYAADCPKRSTARRAVQQGLFRQQPPAQLIDRLVDYHVPHSTHEAEAGRGFDIQELEATLAEHWAPLWFKSFAFMGNVPENELPARWRSACAEMAVRFPLDGAYFAAVWRRAEL